VHIPAYDIYVENCIYIISDFITSSSARRNTNISELEVLNDMTNSSAGTGTIDVIPPPDTSYWSPVKVTGVTMRHSKSTAMTDKNSNFRNLLLFIYLLTGIGIYLRSINPIVSTISRI